jgi:short-subunit dehydrogenase
MNGPEGLMVVAGATSGIGLAVAEAAARREVPLVLLGHQEVALSQAVARVRGLGTSTCKGRLCDLTSAQQVKSAVEFAQQQGRIRTWIHCAGAMTYGEVVETPAAAFEHVLTVNVNSVFSAAQAVMPIFRQQEEGFFIVLGSALGHVAVPDIAPYVTSKWALRGLLGTLRLEQRQYPQIHVVEIAPWAVDTPIFDRAATFGSLGGRPPPPLEQANTVAEAVFDILARPPRWTRTHFVGPFSRWVSLAHSASPAPADRLLALLWRWTGTTNLLEPGRSMSERSGRGSSLSHDTRISGGWTGRWWPRSLVRADQGRAAPSSARRWAIQGVSRLFRYADRG